MNNKEKWISAITEITDILKVPHKKIENLIPLNKKFVISQWKLIEKMRNGNHNFNKKHLLISLILWQGISFNAFAHEGEDHTGTAGAPRSGRARPRGRRPP